MRISTLILFILLATTTYSQESKNYELAIENCIKEKYLAVGLDIDKEFNIFQDTLIAHGVISGKNNGAIYALYDIVLSNSYYGYINQYHINKLDENMTLFHDCIFQFKSDTTAAFEKTKIHKLYKSLDKINNMSNVNIDTLVSSIKDVIHEDDMNYDIYKYYTLYAFYSFATTSGSSIKVSLPKSETNTNNKKIISVSIDKKQRLYINGKKTNKEDIGKEIDNITGTNPNKYTIVLHAHEKAKFESAIKVMQIAKDKKIVVTIVQ